MKYKELKRISNPYPSPENYRRIADRIVLVGNFDDNTVKFDIQSLDDIKYAEGTSFRFIIAFSKSPQVADASPQKQHYYTSEVYYNDLQRAINENNPYFTVENSVKVYVYTDALGHLMETQLGDEEDWKVEIRNAIGISLDEELEETYHIDYNRLAKYIDWLVSRPDSFDEELLPVNDIADISSDIDDDIDEDDVV